jgi:polar amino acid transport system substrate-binding protein
MLNRFSEDLPRNVAEAESCGTTLQIIRKYLEKRGIFSMIDAILDSGRHASQIVENMLNFSRKSESRYNRVNIVELLEKTLTLVLSDYNIKRKYDFRKIEISREFDPDLPEVECDSSKIQQVFFNILKNGAEAMGDKSYTGEGPQFTLRVKRESEMARIEIEDNGPGMSEEIRRRIFEPFFTTKEVGFGTGLGLSLSYFIITENHNGTLSVESLAGKRSNFIIRLPWERSTVKIMNPKYQ